jgi:hypothetical protein
MIARGLAIIALAAIGFAGAYFFTRKAPPPAKVARPTYEQISERVLPQVELHQTTFGGAIRYVHEVTGLDVVVDWPAESKGIVYDMPFDPDLSLHDVTLDTFIDRLNNSIDHVVGQLGFRLHDGYVEVVADNFASNDFGSDSEADPRNTETCIYNVANLILADGPWERIVPPLRNQTGSAPMTTFDRQQLLEQTIINIVDPETWKDAGGSSGALRILNGQLIVTHTPPHQRAIYQLIKTLRAAK